MRAFQCKFGHAALMRGITGRMAVPMTMVPSRAWCATTPGTPAETAAADAAAKAKAADEAEAKQADGGKAPVTQEAFAALEKELEVARERIESLKNDVLYRAADAENARRIAREDVDKAKLFGISSFGKDMLEVADTLEKGIEAFASIPEEKLAENANLASLYTGVKLSSKVLLKNLSKHGIEKMNVKVGMPFDFNYHEALARMPPTEAAPVDTIAHVMKDGYTIKSRVLRAAQVAVSSTD